MDQRDRRSKSVHRIRAVIVTLLGALLLFLGSLGMSQAAEEVPFEELEGDQCFMFSQLVPRRLAGNDAIELPLELVINDEDDYKKLFDPQIMRQSCVNVEVSSRIRRVDFSKKTVLGFWNSGSCAASGFEKKVIKDDARKLIVYSVRVIASDIDCSGPGRESLNLIAIPKVLPSYRVFFEKSP